MYPSTNERKNSRIPVVLHGPGLTRAQIRNATAHNSEKYMSVLCGANLLIDMGIATNLLLGRKEESNVTLKWGHLDKRMRVEIILTLIKQYPIIFVGIYSII